MLQIWFISDTHFGHANMLKFTKPDGTRVRSEFSSLAEMDETMVSRWNAVVRDQDLIYHLGDVTFRYDGYFNNIISRLRGRKRLIIGNHDKINNPNLLRHFEKAEIWHVFRDHGFTCSHIPLRLDDSRTGLVNVHGHTHEVCLDDPRYLNICVEQTAYSPVSLDWVLTEIKQRGLNG